MHPDAGAAGGHHGGDLFQRQEGHPLKECRDLGVLVDLALSHIQELGAAGHKQRQDPAFFVVRVFAVQVLPVVFHYAQPRHFGQQLFQRLPLHFG